MDRAVFAGKQRQGIIVRVATAANQLGPNYYALQADFMVPSHHSDGPTSRR